MKVFIDGENCRKGLAEALETSGVISNSRQMIDYRLRGLLEDVLETKGVKINYYASKIKPHFGYVSVWRRTCSTVRTLTRK